MKKAVLFLLPAPEPWPRDFVWGQTGHKTAPNVFPIKLASFATECREF